VAGLAVLRDDLSAGLFSHDQSCQRRQ
jgi:hypothetical protein